MTAIYAGRNLREDWTLCRVRWRKLCELARFHNGLYREGIGTREYERIAMNEIYQRMVGASGNQ